MSGKMRKLRKSFILGSKLSHWKGWSRSRMSRWNILNRFRTQWRESSMHKP